MLYGRKHDVAHDFAAVTAGRRHLTHRLTVAAIQCERHAQRLAVIAAKLEAVRHQR